MVPTTGSVKWTIRRNGTRWRCDCGGSMPGRHVPIDPSFQTRVTCLYSAVEKWNRRG